MGIDDDIKAFEASIDKASHQLASGEVLYPAHVQAILSAGIMVSKALVLLTRTNRMVRRA